jgi:hypothetical protein
MLLLRITLERKTFMGDIQEVECPPWGQSAPSCPLPTTSGLPQSTDIAGPAQLVRFVPQAAVSTRNKSLAPIPGSWPGKVSESECTPVLETGRLHVSKPPKIVNDLTNCAFDR